MKAKQVPPSAILAAAREMNRVQCVPPHDDAEVKRIVDHALTQPDSAAFTMMSNETTTTPFKLVSYGQLLAEPDEEVEWLVPGLLKRGGVYLFGGAPKVGKSVLCRDLAYRVAHGSSWWLGQKVAKGKVIYVDLEEHRREVKAYFKKLAVVEGDDLHFVFDRLAPQVLQERVYGLAMELKPDVIFIDVLQRFIGAKDMNDYAEVTTKFTPLLNLARDSGATIIAIHHAAKGSRDRDLQEKFLGSNALPSTVDASWIVERLSPAATTFVALSKDRGEGWSSPAPSLSGMRSRGASRWANSRQNRDSTPCAMTSAERLTTQRSRSRPTHS